jgi:hypothetical protein
MAGESGRILAPSWTLSKPVRSRDCVFALGESMGAAIALQSASVEPRIEGVAAESSFSDLREASYDYAGLRFSPLLGKTLFRPAAIVVVRSVEKEAGFKAEDVSPERPLLNARSLSSSFAERGTIRCPADTPGAFTLLQSELRNCGSCRAQPTPPPWAQHRRSSSGVSSHSTAQSTRRENEARCGSAVAVRERFGI